MSDLYSKVIRIYLKLKALYKRDISYKLYNKLSKEQWMSPAEIEGIQIERFNKLWKHALANSTFYKDRFKKYKLPNKISSVKDISSFPLLNRYDLQNYGQNILCKYDDTIYADSSGGSSGIPVHFYHDAYYKMFGAALHLLFLSWAGVKEGLKTGIFWGADRDFTNLSFKQYLSQRINRNMMLNTFNVTNESLDKFLKELEDYKPDYIFGYSSSLAFAAKNINQSPKYTIHPKAIRATAEMLYDFQRKEIEKAFKCPVFNFYGSREVNNIAAECSAHEGMHVFSSGRIVEIVDENGKPLPIGEIGYIAITDLTNFTFPFIRYINGDMASWNDKPCSCGRAYPLLKGIAGRVFDILSFNGKFIHGHFFSNLIYQNSKVKQFQVIQESESLLVIKIVALNNDVNILELKEKMWHQIGRNIEIDIQFVEKIKPLKSGKYRFTINNSMKNSERPI